MNTHTHTKEYNDKVAAQEKKAEHDAKAHKVDSQNVRDSKIDALDEMHQAIEDLNAQVKSSDPKTPLEFAVKRVNEAFRVVQGLLK